MNRSKTPAAPDEPQHEHEHVHGPGCSHDHSHDQAQAGGSHDSAVGTYRREAPKLGRNDPCFCGSGRKYKKCHGTVAG
jgi:SEC-C motif